MRTVDTIRDMQAVLHAVTEFSGLETAVFSRIERNRWCARAVLDGGGFGIEPGHVYPVGDVLCEIVGATLTPLAVGDLTHHAQYRTHPTRTKFGAEAYVGVPVKFDDGTLIGTLCALSKRPKPRTDRAVPLMSLLGQLVAHELQLENVAQHTETRLKSEQSTAEERERFLAMVAHDLRNPLTSIRTNAEVLARNVADDLRSAAGRILGVTERMVRLIDDLLDLSRGRIGAGIALRRVRLQPKSFLAAFLAELAAANPQATLKSELHDLVPFTDAWDGDRVAQLLDNVISNAIQHGEGKPVVVRARLVGRTAQIDVLNNGAAIPDDVLETLFEPFHRTSAPTRGLGLGLYIAHQIARAHGGDIRARTREGETCLRVTLPL